jgi:hypothetical protein
MQPQGIDEVRTNSVGVWVLNLLGSTGLTSDELPAVHLNHDMAACASEALGHTAQELVGNTKYVPVSDAGSKSW